MANTLSDPPSSHVETRFIRRDGHAERLRSVALQFVERNLHRLAHIRAKQSERVGKGAAVFEMRQGHKILGVILGHCAKTPVVGEGHVKDAGDGVQRNAIDNLRPFRIDDRDLRLGRRSIFEARAQRRRIGIDMCRVNPPAIGREREITRAAPGQQALFLRARLRIEHGNVAGDAVGDKDLLARRVFDNAGWLRADAARWPQRPARAYR